MRARVAARWRLPPKPFGHPLPDGLPITESSDARPEWRGTLIFLPLSVKVALLCSRRAVESVLKGRWAS